MTKRHIPDWIWKVAAFLLAGAFAVTFTLQQVRGNHTSNTVDTSSHTLTQEKDYLADLAIYANYIAVVNKDVCDKLVIHCPPSPHFPDPDGLPALGIPNRG